MHRTGASATPASWGGDPTHCHHWRSRPEGRGTRAFSSPSSQDSGGPHPRPACPGETRSPSLGLPQSTMGGPPSPWGSRSGRQGPPRVCGAEGGQRLNEKSPAQTHRTTPIYTCVHMQTPAPRLTCVRHTEARLVPIHTCARTRTRLHPPTHLRVHTCTCTCTCTHTQMCTQAHVCTQPWMVLSAMVAASAHAFCCRPPSRLLMFTDVISVNSPFICHAERMVK